MASDASTGQPEPPLAERVAAELTADPPDVVAGFARAIRDRHGSSVAAILFYGSCLRKHTTEGVLDFYVLVDRYRDAYDGVGLPVLNALVPPNVFYVEHRDEAAGTLRAKYAVLSLAAFERVVSPRCHQPYFWARFCQPTRIAWARDPAAVERVVAGAEQAAITLVRRLAVFLPASGRIQRFSLAMLWREAFRRTYGSELRTESEETIRAVYEAEPARYDAVARGALVRLRESGWITGLEVRGDSVEVDMPRARRTAARWRWQLERPFSKLLALVRLVKNSATFGDWLPYVLWKIERHTGVVVELTERQRAHPLIFGWPVLFRLVRERHLF